MNKFFNLKVFLIFFVLMAIQSFRGLQKGIIEYPLISTFFALTVVPLFFSFIYAFFFTKRPRQVGKKGYTRLMELCTKGNLDDIKKEFELLKREINLQDDKGYSALVYSVSSGHAEVVKYLLEQGADKKLTSKAGYDAVYFAEKNNQHEIVDLLKKIAS